MVINVSLNTYTALQKARGDGIILPRYFVWITGKNRSTKALEHIGIWNGGLPETVPVQLPDTGAVVNRVFQGLGNRMEIPPIPMEMTLKVQSIQLSFSRLSPAIIDAVRVYDSRKQSIQIFRGLLDKDSRKLVDPAYCVWDGMVNRVPITRAKANDDGKVVIETVSNARWLTMASGDKMDSHFFERRGDKAGRFISTIWRIPIPWGSGRVIHSRRVRPKEVFFD